MKRRGFLGSLAGALAAFTATKAADAAPVNQITPDSDASKLVDQSWRDYLEAKKAWDAERESLKRDLEFAKVQARTTREAWEAVDWERMNYAFDSVSTEMYWQPSRRPPLLPEYVGCDYCNTVYKTDGSVNKCTNCGAPLPLLKGRR